MYSTSLTMSTGRDGVVGGLKLPESRQNSIKLSNESSRLIAYKNAVLDKINSNHVNHHVIKESPDQPSTSGAPSSLTPVIPVLRSSGIPESFDISTLMEEAAPPPRVKTARPWENHDCQLSGCERVRINVSGQYFETRLNVLNRHPDTLLGNPFKRRRFYDGVRNEYFIDRHRPSFEAIFAHLQNGGRLRRPEDVPDEIFIDELYFYEMESDVVNEYKINEGYTDDKQVQPGTGWMRTVWITFEHPETSPLAFGIAVISVVFTLISIVLFCIETLPVFAVSHCVKDEAPNFLDPFFIIETLCTYWFTFEICIRFVVCPGKLAFWKDFKNIVDVTAVVPYFVTFFQVVSTMSCASAKSSASLSFFRVIRLIRIFKLTKHSVGLQVLIMTFRASLEGLGLFLVAIMFCLLVFSSAIYYAEFGIDGSQIHSIPDAFWWAIITMTTVGYGDKVPVGVWGRLIGTMCALVGVLTLAIPVPIITGNFNRFYAHKMGKKIN